MVSKFGDIYDHVGDVITMVAVLGSMCFLNSALFLLFFPVYLWILCLRFVHIGYTELYYGKAETVTLSAFKRLCSSKNRDEVVSKIKYTRFFGMGTSVAYVGLMILVYGSFYRNKLK